jgi:arabinose-5-phosphate isomerase
LVGVFTDGDLRRALDTTMDIRAAKMHEVMHRGGIVSSPDTMAAAAVHTMEQNKITALMVVDNTGKLIGALNVHDLFRAGVM